MQIEQHFQTGEFGLALDSWTDEAVRLADERYTTMINGKNKTDSQEYLPPTKREQSLGFCRSMKDPKDASPHVPFPLKLYQ
jgi:hypothetical protein